MTPVPRERGQLRYDERTFRPRRTRFCIAVFALNEGVRLHQQLERMSPFLSAADLVLSDGDSCDDTADPSKLDALGARAVLVRRSPGKLGTQMRAAFDWALHEGYEGVIVMDGNGKDDPEAIPRFATALNEGYDHVQGSRFLPGGVSENLPFSRLLAIRCLHAPLVRWAAGFPYTDTTNGFRAYSRRVLSSTKLSLFREVFRDYALHYYLAIRAPRLGFRATEIPVARRYPPRGPVPTKITFLRGNLRVLGCLLSACLGRYNPGKPSQSSGPDRPAATPWGHSTQASSGQIPPATPVVLRAERDRCDAQEARDPEESGFVSDSLASPPERIRAPDPHES